MHFLYVHLDSTMDPMSVRAANALMRLCICLVSSELSMLAYNRQVCLISWHVFQVVFLLLRARRRRDFVP